MDDQHGILMDTTNELRLALVHGSGREQVSEILDRLIEFTRMHFWSEEKLMAEAEYPGLAEHRAEHHRMLAEMIQTAHSLQYGEGPQTHQMLCALRDGYLEHIGSIDRLYTPWLHEKGIS
jgi:hemerythrin